MKRELLVSLLSFTLVLAAVWFAAPATCAGEPVQVNITVPMTKGDVVPVRSKVGPLTFNEVEVHNAPNEEDLQKAQSDKGDNCHPKLALGISNSGTSLWKIKLSIKLESKDGQVFMSCDRTDDVKPGADDDHTNFCWLDSMKTIDWPKIAKIHIVGTVSEKTK